MLLTELEQRSFHVEHCDTCLLTLLEVDGGTGAAPFSPLATRILLSLSLSSTIVEDAQDHSTSFFPSFPLLTLISPCHLRVPVGVIYGGGSILLVEVDRWT